MDSIIVLIICFFYAVGIYQVFKIFERTKESKTAAKEREIRNAEIESDYPGYLQELDTILNLN